MKKIKYVLLAVCACMIFAGCSEISGTGNGGSTEISGDGGTSTADTEPSGFIKVKGGTITGTDYTNNYFGVFLAGRTVTLSDFYIGKYEVTQAEYKEVMQNQTVTVGETDYTLAAEPSWCTEENKSDFAVNFGTDYGKRPVERVTWYDAVYYCNARSVQEDLTCAYEITVKTVSEGHISDADVTLVDNANGYRLPTEVEWEYAARGGDSKVADWDYTFSGANTESGNNRTYDSRINEGLDTVGWYCYNNDTGTTGSTDVTNDNSGMGTHEVGKKAANRLGLYDMSGNVWEWCWDWYSETVDSSTPVTGSDSGSERVIRGGGWNEFACYCSVSFRYSQIPSCINYYSYGFRVVRSCVE